MAEPDAHESKGATVLYMLAVLCDVVKVAAIKEFWRFYGTRNLLND